MKIVYISSSIIPSRTANSIHVMKMCQAFADNGHEVVLLAPDRYKEYESGVNDVYKYYGVQPNFKLIKIKYKYIKGKILFQLIDIYRILRNEKPDLVYGRYTPGCMLSSILKFRTIFESHSPVWESGLMDKMSFNLMIKQKNFKALTVISNALKSMYIERNIIEPDRILVAHDGADEAKDLDSKAQLFGEQNSLKVGYVGHLYKGRGIELILECAIKIGDMTFHIVGGTNLDIEYWKNHVKVLGLTNVYFYGFVAPNEAVSYRNSFDIVLAPYAEQVSVSGNIGDTSRYMSPLKIFEYMSHRKAIVCSDLPVLREVLNDTNSVLVNPKNIQEWINAIDKLRDAEKSKILADKAFLDFSKKYSWKIRAEKLIDGFKSL